MQRSRKSPIGWMLALAGILLLGTAGFLVLKDVDFGFDEPMSAPSRPSPATSKIANNADDAYAACAVAVNDKLLKAGDRIGAQPISVNHRGTAYLFTGFATTNTGRKEWECLALWDLNKSKFTTQDIVFAK